VSAAHTPGPWAAGASGDRVYPHLVKDSEGTPVARAVIVADARLIAAAPELLAVAQGLLALASHCKTYGLSDLLLQARAAIARASAP